MSVENLREILNSMRGRTPGTVYKGGLPMGVKKIIRITVPASDCSEVVLDHLEGDVLRQMASEAGLRYEKKSRADEFACGCAMRVLARMRATDAISSYEITKPRRFWFSVHVADVVNGSVRLYDTRQSIELTAELLEKYLKTEGQTIVEKVGTRRANGYSRA